MDNSFRYHPAKVKNFVTLIASFFKNYLVISSTERNTSNVFRFTRVFLCEPQIYNSSRALLVVIIEKPEVASYPGDTLTYVEEGKRGERERERVARVSFGMRLTPEKKKKKGWGRERNSS